MKSILALLLAAALGLSAFESHQAHSFKLENQRLRDKPSEADLIRLLEMPLPEQNRKAWTDLDLCRMGAMTFARGVIYGRNLMRAQPAIDGNNAVILAWQNFRRAELTPMIPEKSK